MYSRSKQLHLDYLEQWIHEQRTCKPLWFSAQMGINLNLKAMLYKDQVDKTRIPAHIAIIMDGNGRWAKQRGQARSFGHQAGAETVHVIAEEAARLGVKFLTLYTFSTENWSRPADEVAALMSLLMDSIEEETFMKTISVSV